MARREAGAQRVSAAEIRREMKSLSDASAAKEQRPPFDPAAGFQKDFTRIPLPN